MVFRFKILILPENSPPSHFNSFKTRSRQVRRKQGREKEKPSERRGDRNDGVTGSPELQTNALSRFWFSYLTFPINQQTHPTGGIFRNTDKGTSLCYLKVGAINIIWGLPSVYGGITNNYAA